MELPNRNSNELHQVYVSTEEESLIILLKAILAKMWVEVPSILTSHTKNKSSPRYSAPKDYPRCM